MLRSQVLPPGSHPGYSIRHTRRIDGQSQRESFTCIRFSSGVRRLPGRRETASPNDPLQLLLIQQNRTSQTTPPAIPPSRPYPRAKTPQATTPAASAPGPVPRPGPSPSSVTASPSTADHELPPPDRGRHPLWGTGEPGLGKRPGNSNNNKMVRNHQRPSLLIVEEEEGTCPYKFQDRGASPSSHS